MQPDLRIQAEPLLVGEWTAAGLLVINRTTLRAMAPSGQLGPSSLWGAPNAR